VSCLTIIQFRTTDSFSSTYLLLMFSQFEWHVIVVSISLVPCLASYVCSITPPYTNSCLLGRRWLIIFKFRLWISLSAEPLLTPLETPSVPSILFLPHWQDRMVCTWCLPPPPTVWLQAPDLHQSDSLRQVFFFTNNVSATPLNLHTRFYLLIWLTCVSCWIKSDVKSTQAT
jgi:hypothetical protein